MFISIDDNEVEYLKALLNDVFDKEDIDVMIWKKSGDDRYGKMKNTTTFRKDHEYVVVVFRDQKMLNKIIEKPFFKNEYSNPDNDPRGPYKAGSISRIESASDPLHENYYTVVSPSGKKFTRQFEIPEEDFKQLNDDKRIYWGKNNDAVPAIKIFLNEKREITPYSVLSNQGSTYSGKIELRRIFDIDTKEDIFENPKPSSLIRTLVQLSTKIEENDIVLDSFAGSGTTANAVLDLNKEDGGNRKFILVQLSEEIKKETFAYKLGFRWVHEITRERVKRVIAKNKYKAGFTYYTLGSSIDAESILTGKLPTYKEFAKYVYYLATGKNHPDDKKIKEEDSFVGKTDHQSVYLVYEKNVDALKKLAITLDWAQKTHKKDANKKIVYAPACYLDDEALEQFNIKFVSIPYNLFERST